MLLSVLLIIIYVAFISLGLPDGLLGSAWPTIKMAMDVPNSYAGIVSMIIAIGTIVSSLFSDRLIRKFKTPTVTYVSVLLTAGALLGISFSTKFYHLIIFAIPLGIGAGSVDAALNNYVAINYKAKHMNWLHAFWGIGAMTGPMIMGYFLEKGFVFQKGYQVVSIIQFVLVAILIISLPLWKKAAKIKKDNTNNSQEEEHNPKVLGIGGLLKLPGAKQVLIAFFCYCALESTFGLWSASYVENIHFVSAEAAAKWASLFYIGITVGRVISGFVSYKLSSRKMIYIGLIVIGIGSILVFLKINEISTITGLIAVGLGCAPIYPNLIHITPENFGKEYSQSVIGIQMASAYVGTTLMPPLFGLIAKSVGIKILPIYGAFLLLLMFIMIKVLNKRTSHLHKEKFN
jgi:fucose permease